jgi:lipid II:glycine glycyltransferase (peptidoglycan interpeptide bridge formation enzyme)
MESVYEVARLGKTVNLDLRSPEQILGNMDRRKRQQVLRALEAGVRVYWGLDENLPEPFMEMYNRTMDKNNAKSYYYFEKAFFESLVTGLKTHTMFFYARVEGAIAAMCIVFYYNGIMNGLLLSSNEIGRELVPVNLMIYEAALWGAANGYTDLHIGSGVGGKNDSLYVFKKKFNKHSDHDFIIGKKIFDKSAYQELITMRESEGTTELDHGYFPEYRG